MANFRATFILRNAFKISIMRNKFVFPQLLKDASAAQLAVFLALPSIFFIGHPPIAGPA